jgi:PBP superfamily domain
VCVCVSVLSVAYDHAPDLVLTMVSLFPCSCARHCILAPTLPLSLQYLNSSCPDVWPSDWVGDVVENWPNDTLPCSGSSGMVTCIEANPGAIGYIETGHGFQAGLEEIDLSNKAGNSLSSKRAAELGGIAAAEADKLPDSFDEDFSDVSLLNGDGENTWPIVLISYIYVRKNLTSITDPNEKSLLVAFLNALYEPAYTDVCLTDFGFVRPSDDVVAKAKKAIDEMIILDADSQEWFYESTTAPIAGMGDYVLSPNRKSIRDIQLDTAGDAIEDVLARVLELEDIVRLSDSEIVSLREKVSAAEKEVKATENDSFSSRDARRLKAALIMAILSFVMTLILLVLFALRSSGKA